MRLLPPLSMQSVVGRSGKAHRLLLGGIKMAAANHRRHSIGLASSIRHRQPGGFPFAPRLARAAAQTVDHNLKYA